MPVALSNPTGLAAPPPVYQHVAISTGSRHVHIAGQVSTGAGGERVAPGDLAGQVAQAYRNVATALASVQATFADVVRLTFYVVDWKPSMTDDLLAGIESVRGELGLGHPPVTLIGVAALFEPDILFELEATAILD